MGTYYTHGATKASIVSEILNDLKTEPYHPFKDSWDYEKQCQIPGPPQRDLNKTCRRLEHKLAGSNLWILFEVIDNGQRQVTVLLYKLSSSGGSFGYKPMDESMGPYEYNVPFTWLARLTAAPSPYAEAWRKKVRSAYGNHPAPTHGNEQYDFGGTFDGFSVSSDADGGL